MNKAKKAVIIVLSILLVVSSLVSFLSVSIRGGIVSPMVYKTYMPLAGGYNGMYPEFKSFVLSQTEYMELPEEIADVPNEVFEAAVPKDYFTNEVGNLFGGGMGWLLYNHEDIKIPVADVQTRIQTAIDENETILSDEQNLQEIMSAVMTMPLSSFMMISERGEDVTADTTVSEDYIYVDKVYAKWKSNASTITFDKQGGAGGYANVRPEYGSQMPAASAPSREGYTFEGYFSEANGSGVEYYDANMQSTHEWDVIGDAVLYANWSVNDIMVTFDANGGVFNDGSTTEDIQLAFDGQYQLPENSPTREGYIFEYWNAKADGTGDLVNNTVSISYADDHTFYAVWVAEEFSVLLDMQGGYSNTTRLTHEYNADVIENAPAKSGYTFNGYYSEPDGEGKEYLDADMDRTNNWDISGEVVLYADWIPVNVDVIFNANNIDTVVVEDAEESESTEGTDDVDNSDSAENTENTDDEEEQIEGETVVQVYGEKYTLPDSIPEKDNYDFIGWNTQPDGSGEMVDAATEVLAPSRHFLFATWKGEDVNITFDANAGEFADDNTTQFTVQTYGDLYQMPEVTPTRAGYKLIGWYTKSNGSGDKINEEIQLLETENHTLYAKWKIDKPIVSLDRQGGSEGNGTVNAEYGSSMPEAEAPIKEGFTFGGYYSELYGRGEQYYDASMNSMKDWDINGSGTIYAYWIGNDVPVIYDANGGTFSNGETEITVVERVGDKYQLTGDTPTREGYIFNGWNTQVNGNENTLRGYMRYYLSGGVSGLEATWDYYFDVYFYYFGNLLNWIAIGSLALTALLVILLYILSRENPEKPIKLVKALLAIFGSLNALMALGFVAGRFLIGNVERLADHADLLHIAFPLLLAFALLYAFYSIIHFAAFAVVSAYQKKLKAKSAVKEIDKESSKA